MKGVPILGRAVSASLVKLVWSSTAGPPEPSPERSLSRDSSRLRRSPTTRETRRTRLLAMRNAVSVTTPSAGIAGYLPPSEIEIDALADPERTERLSDHGAPDELGIFQQDPGVLAVHEQHQQEHPRGQPEQDDRLEPAFGGQGPDLAAQLVAFADDAGELVEHLGE